MCEFVFIGIPQRARAHADALRSEYSLDETRNASILRIFPETDAVLSVTRGGCSCGLCASEQQAARFDAARERRKYEKKGWSKAKIDRAMAGRRTATTQPAIEAFRNAVGALVRNAGSLRLLVHTIRGAVETEQVPAHPLRRVTLDEYLAAEGIFDWAFALDIQLLAHR